MTSVPTLGFEYRCSPMWRRVLALMAILALIAITLCGLPWWLKWLAAGLTVALWRYEHHAHVGVGVTRVAWYTADGRWWLQRADGHGCHATLQSYRLLGEFIWLGLRERPRRRVTLVLAPDNSDNDIRRRLRMRLVACHWLAIRA